MSDPKDGIVLAIDAGGTFFKSALVDSLGEIVSGTNFQIPACSSGTKPEIISAYRHAIGKGFELAKSLELAISGIGIATPGPFDYARGMSLMSHKFQAIREVLLREEFYSFGIFDEILPVVFMQDVHAFLTGEHWTGAVKNVDNIAAITLGTGLGFGVMQNGIIVDNGKGGPGLVIFNRPYKNGILEDVISRRGIIARYGNESSDLDVRQIADRAKSGDEKAKKVFRETGEIAARELRNIFTDYETEAIVFGGQISKSFELFGPSFQRQLADLGLDISVTPGKNLEFSSLAGTAKIIFS